MEQINNATSVVLMSFVLLAGVFSSASLTSAFTLPEVDSKVEVWNSGETSADTNSGNVGVGSSTESSVNARANTNGRGNGITANAVLSSNSHARVQSLDDIEEEFEDEDDEDSLSVRERVRELENSVDSESRASSFVHVSHGSGWAISSEDEGSFARIVIVERTFVNSTNNNSAEFTAGNGVLKLSGEPAFNLRFDSSTDDTIVFDVVSDGETEGTLTLTRETSLTGFAVWSGELELDSGVSYDLDIATIDSKIKGNGEIQQNSDVEAKLESKSDKERGFWARLKAFLRVEANAEAEAEA